MKAEQDTTFTPVTITLESQEEVDRLWAILEGVKNEQVTGLPHGCELVLRPYVKKDYVASYLNKLRECLRRD